MTVRIRLYGGPAVAIVDDRDASLALLRWRLERREGVCYAAATLGRRQIRLHRAVMREEVLPGQCVDHVNGDGLDCRRANLRVADSSTNGHNRPMNKNNTSGYKGVCWDRQHGKWKASIMVRGVLRGLGGFRDPQDAARAYDKAARASMGGFAALNFPEPGERCAR